jgi:hypothetical protein
VLYATLAFRVGRAATRLSIAQRQLSQALPIEAWCSVFFLAFRPFQDCWLAAESLEASKIARKWRLVANWRSDGARFMVVPSNETT